MELGNVHNDDGYVTTVMGNGNDKESEVSSSSLRQFLVNTYRCTRSRTIVLFSRLVVAVGL
jgi:hypothetical protein